MLSAGDMAEAAKIPSGKRTLQSRGALTVGAYTDGSSAFHGRAAYVSLFDVVLSPEQLAAVMHVRLCMCTS